MAKKHSEKTNAYQSYLVRCWVSPKVQAGAPVVRRFIVETISDKPRRWGFDTFAELVAFLQTELLKERPSDEADH